MQTLAVMVTSPPFSNFTATALDYLQTALEQGVKVVGVFFYQSAVLNANKNVNLASDEFQSQQAWKKLSQHYQLPLYLCITAAEKHGLSDEQANNNIDEIFTVAGLGELVEISSLADRVVQL